MEALGTLYTHPVKWLQSRLTVLNVRLRSKALSYFAVTQPQEIKYHLPLTQKSHFEVLT
jgi:hypothetical protein